MEIKFKDIKIPRKGIVLDSDIKIISNKAKELKEKNKAIVFNYKDTDDFKKPIPDFSGFKQKIYLRLKLDYPDSKWMIRAHRETGEIEVILVELDKNNK